MTEKTQRMTLRDRLDQGFGAEELKPVSLSEGIDPDVLADLVHGGQVALLGTSVRRGPRVAVGHGQLTKSSLTLSPQFSRQAIDEWSLHQFFRQAQDLELDTVLDLGFFQGGELWARRLMKAWQGPVLVQPFLESKTPGDLGFSAEEMLGKIQWALEMGAAGVVLPVGLHKDFLHRFEGHGGRLRFSPGSRALAKWMLTTNKENPLNERFEDLLELFREADAVMVMENALSAMSLQEAAMETAHYQHFITLSDMAGLALERGVMTMLHVGGYFPLHDMRHFLTFLRSVTQGLPVMLEGPMPTHLSGATAWGARLFGSLIAAQEGADLVLSPPVEKIGQGSPSPRDLMALTRLISHLADVTRGNPRALEREYGILEAQEQGRGTEDFLLDPEPRQEPDPPQNPESVN